MTDFPILGRGCFGVVGAESGIGAPVLLSESACFDPFHVKTCGCIYVTVQLRIQVFLEAPAGLIRGIGKAFRRAVREPEWVVWRGRRGISILTETEALNRGWEDQAFPQCHRCS